MWLCVFSVCYQFQQLYEPLSCLSFSLFSSVWGEQLSEAPQGSFYPPACSASLHRLFNISLSTLILDKSFSSCSPLSWTVNWTSLFNCLQILLIFSAGVRCLTWCNISSCCLKWIQTCSLDVGVKTLSYRWTKRFNNNMKQSRAGKSHPVKSIIITTKEIYHHTPAWLMMDSLKLMQQNQRYLLPTLPTMQLPSVWSEIVAANA